MKLSNHNSRDNKHPISEYVLVTLMAIIVLFAAFIIKVSNFCVTRLNPALLISKVRAIGETEKNSGPDSGIS